MEAREQQFSYGGAYGGGESGYVLPAAAYSAGAPPQPSQPHYLLAARHRSLCSTATTACDEVTAAQSGGGGGGGGGGAAPARPRGGSDTAGTGVCTRRRKCLSGSDLEEDTGDEEHSQRAPDGKKQNHSEIEKRRRDKMNTYITELSSMVPMCGAMARKLDKLTVLRMAVQHLKRVRGAAHAFPEGRHRPAFLSERELKMLILQAAEGFLFVADCDRGRVLYVSESVARALHYSQPELLGQSLFDLLHPKDVAKVKEQLSASDLSPRERLIDATTMLPVRADVAAGASRLSPGARRSFFCRMKRKPGTRRELAHAHAHVKQEHDTGPGAHPHRKLALTERKYSVVQCTGYLKAWSGGVAGGDAAGGEPAEPGEEGGGGAGSGAGGALSCLVAVGRTLPELPRRAADSPSTRRLQFVSRHATDGKFIYVDQRATPALGFLPQELLGTSLYEYAAPAQVGELARLHKAALLTAQPQSTPPYAFRRKNGSYARLQTDWKPFRNPWTKELECLVANNTLLDLCADQLAASPPGAPAADDDTSRYFTRPGAETETEVQRLIHCQLESHKIGSAIAEEVLRRRADSPPAAPRGPPLHSDLLHDLTAFAPAPASPLAHQLQVQASASGVAAAVETSLLPHFAHVRNNVTLSAAAPGEEEEEEEVLRSLAAPAPAPAPAAQRPPPPAPAAPPDGNDEAAMAVIMSLLEADAGLGGPVDFSGLPWPLP